MDKDVTAVAEYFEIAPGLVEEALAYAREYADEVEALIHRHEAVLAERLLADHDNLAVQKPHASERL